MVGFSRFLRKEVVEILRTWRLPVIAGTVLLFAVTGPLLALATPALLKSMSLSQPGLVIQLPDPTWRDAYAQWLKNLSQIVAFVAVISAAGTVAGEVASGTAVLVLTKPVSRGSFVVAKAVAFIGLVHGSTVLGAAVTQVITYLVFGRAPGWALWGPTAVWLVLVAFLIAVATALSTVLPTLAAAGVSLGAFFALSLAALWGPLARFSPAGLTTASGELLTGGHPALFWPVVTGLLGTACLTALGARLLSRREL